MPVGLIEVVDILNVQVSRLRETPGAILPLAMFYGITMQCRVRQSQCFTTDKTSAFICVNKEVAA